MDVDDGSLSYDYRSPSTASRSSPMSDSRMLDLIDSRLDAKAAFVASAAANTKASAISAKQSISAMIEDHLDAKAAVALKSAAVDPSMSQQSISAMIDERLNAKKLESAMIDERVQARLDSLPVRQGSVAQSVATPSPSVNVGTSFHTKPMDEQRAIVGAAVQSVMKDYHVTPKNGVASGLSSYRNGASTASSIHDYGRY